MLAVKVGSVAAGGGIAIGGSVVTIGRPDVALVNGGRIEKLVGDISTLVGPGTVPDLAACQAAHSKGCKLVAAASADVGGGGAAGIARVVDGTSWNWMPAFILVLITGILAVKAAYTALTMRLSL